MVQYDYGRHSHSIPYIYICIYFINQLLISTALGGSIWLWHSCHVQEKQHHYMTTRRSNWDTAGGGLLWDTAGEPLLDNVRYQQHSYSTVYYLNTVYSWQFSNDVQCKIWKVMRSGCFLARTPRQRQDNLPVSSILLIQGSVSTCISWYIRTNFHQLLFPPLKNWHFWSANACCLLWLGGWLPVLA